MPGYKGHIFGGLIAYLIILLIISVYYTAQLNHIEWLLCAVAGSLFPDIDTKSKGQKLFYSLIIVLLFYLMIQEHMQLFMGVAFASTIPLLVKHRGLCHKVWFVILVPLCTGLACAHRVPEKTTMILLDTLFFIAGALSHLWLDFGL